MNATQRKEALEAFAQALRARFPDGVQVFLYGSEARGEAAPDSDIDVLLIVQAELKRAVREEAAQIVSHFTSAGTPYISVVVKDHERWQRLTPFNEQVRRDAVAL